MKGKNRDWRRSVPVKMYRDNCGIRWAWVLMQGGAQGGHH